MSDDFDAQKALDDLNRQAKRWKFEEAARERRKAKALAEIQSLEPKASRIKDNLIELRHEEELANTVLGRLNKEIEDAVDKIADSKTELGRLEELRRKTEADNERQKQDLYTKFAAYEEVKKAEFDEFLAEIATKIKDREAFLEGLNAGITTSMERGAQMNQATEDAEKAHKDRLDALAQEAIDIDAGNKDLRKTNQRLRVENSTLLATNNDLKKRNAELDANHAKFLAYEKKAIAALEATDTGLRVREQAVAEKEQYRPPTKSFLPPVE